MQIDFSNIILLSGYVMLQEYDTTIIEGIDPNINGIGIVKKTVDDTGSFNINDIVFYKKNNTFYLKKDGEYFYVVPLQDILFKINASS